ncbi:DUF418 domain-containing protein [Halosquirtibacter xylanolyticus]|uniref:DUF418 domain-containing protein n=1 Tax=Halosquirtibacter xylanolyticus TaxID=3374599 RepID=UPI0037498B6C|nr:DUF418 domain-containing protein [Prolixibacteraceae bacterium]
MNTPLTSTHRIELVDFLRGFALMAIILLHHLEHFNLFGHPKSTYEWLNILDACVYKGIFFLFAGKAYSIFSILFGLSFWIQYRNAQQRGHSYDLRFMWRMIVLMVIAFCHATFYNGDILMFYAVVGLLLPFLQKLKDRWLILIVVVCFLQPYDLYVAIESYLNPTQSFTINRWSVYANQWAKVAETPNIWDNMVANWKYGLLFDNLWQIENGRFFHLIIYYIIGMRLGKANSFEVNKTNNDFWKYLFLICLSLSVLSIAFIPEANALCTSKYFHHSYGIITEGLKKFFMTGVWISLLTLLWFRFKGMKWQRWFVPYGRMSLTNYISQSILGVFIYYPMGLGLYNKVGATISVVIALIVFVSQCLFSWWWLRRYKQGPIEYVWKKLTWIRI